VVSFVIGFGSGMQALQAVLCRLTKTNTQTDTSMMEHHRGVCLAHELREGGGSFLE